MTEWYRFVGPNHALELFGVKLVGVNEENGKKLLFSIAFVAVVLLLNAALRRLAQAVAGGRGPRVAFWSRQLIRLGSTVLIAVGLLSIWFDDPTRLATAMGLVTAGLAFALQRVVTALAGYAVILRGDTFSVGDRITMGGVRGDVIQLGFLQTTIMEMGQPTSVQSADPAMWVRARQYTGRIVTVTNAKVFDEPVYNYTRDFPYVWEEMTVPVAYRDDRAAAERVLLEAAARHTLEVAAVGEADLREIERRFDIARTDLRPRVYWRLTDNWLELTVRFITRTHGIRDVKDAMARDVLAGLDAAGIGIASATFEVVGLPTVRVRSEPAADGRRDPTIG